MKHIKNFKVFENSNQFSPELQEFMDEHGYSDPAENENHAIIWASGQGYLDVVKELLKFSNVNPADVDNYAIQYASETGQSKVVRELLKDPRVDPTVHDNISIRTAGALDQVDVVKELLKDPRVDPSTVDLNFISNEKIRKLLTMPKKLRDQLIHDDEDFTAMDDFGFFENKK